MGGKKERGRLEGKAAAPAVSKQNGRRLGGYLVRMQPPLAFDHSY